MTDSALELRVVSASEGEAQIVRRDVGTMRLALARGGHAISLDFSTDEALELIGAVYAKLGRSV